MSAYETIYWLFVVVVVLVLVTFRQAFTIRRLRRENRRLQHRIAPFDHDGDGRPGGSLGMMGQSTPKGRKVTRG